MCTNISDGVADSSNTHPELYGPFIWTCFNYFKAAEPLRGGTSLLTTKFLRYICTHLIDLEMIKG